MRILKLVISYLILPGIVCAGTSGASFLKISPGAKPVGMGGAYTAMSGDVNALYFNPAGIGNIKNTQVSAMHTQWISDISYNFAAGAFNVREGVLGLSATLLTMGEMEGRGENREVTDDFAARDFALQCSYAKSLNKNLIGGSFKFISQNIEDESASGIAIDLGIQRKLTNNLNFGTTIRNLGPKMKFISEGFNLPLTLGVGTGLTIGGITLALDTNYEVFNKSMKFSFGTEYLPLQFVSLRGGYFINALKGTTMDSKNLFDPKDGLGGGVGLNISNYSFDYAVVPYSDLGTTQRISVLASF
jgi:hypothetical protein